MKVGPTLVGALIVLVSMPIALFVFQGMWRNRITQELPPPPRIAQREEPARAAVATPPPEEAPPAPKVPLRPIDELLLAVFEGHGVSPGQNLMPDGPRVDLTAQREGSLAHVDLDRDGNWDEVWRIKLDEIVRQVSPRDNGEMSDRYTWTNGEWMPLTADPPQPNVAP